MSQPKYIVDLEFATTTNYPASANPWSGQPRRVRPSAAELAAGVTPGEQLDSTRYNWLLNESLRSASLYGHAALRNWRRLGINHDTGDPQQFTQLARIRANILPSGPANLVPHAELLGVVQRDISDNPDTIVNWTSSGTYWMQPAGGAGFLAGIGLSQMCGDHPEFIQFYGPTGAGARQIRWSNDFLGSLINAGDIAPAGFGFQSMHGAVKQSMDAPRLYAGLTTGATANKIYRSDDGGQTWTACTTPNQTPAVRGFADNGAGIVIAVQGGHSVLQYYRSTDSGVTWSVLSLDPDGLASSFSTGVTYNEVFGQFVIIAEGSGNNSRIYVSADASAGSWTVKDTIDGPNWDVSINKPENAIVSVGPMIAVPVRPSAIGNGATRSLRQGILYSFNLGDNWYFADVCEGDWAPSSGDRLGLTVWNGRVVMATARSAAPWSAVFISDPIWTPAQDI